MSVSPVTRQATDALLQQGLSHHQVGRLPEAEACYRRVLADNPAHAPALHLLGVIALQVGRHDIAVDLIGQAIALAPRVADYHSNQGNALAALGRLGEAEARFREALRLNPKAPVTQNNLGNTLRDQGRLTEAEACYRAALEIEAGYAAAHNNLGNTLRDLGRLDEAVAACRRALDLQPDYAEAHNNLGSALRDRHDTVAAEASFRAALRCKPDYAEAQNNLALVLRDADRLAEAEACCRAALQLDPAYAEAHNNLGGILRDLGRLDEAFACQETALRLKPEFPQAYCDFGNVLHDMEQFDAAEASCRAALQVRPDYPDAQVSLGVALMALDRPSEAEACFRTALGSKPDFPIAHYNLGNCLSGQGRIVEAEASFRQAFHLEPTMANAHYNLGFMLLLAGRLEEAWSEYEWRWQVDNNPTAPQKRSFSQLRWTGEALVDKVLLIHAEQGFGDTIQFCRYVPLAAQRGRIILEVPRGLVRLLSGLPGVERVVASGDPLPPFDVHCPMLSLPGAFGTGLATIPAATPYLSADSSCAKAWQDRLAELPGLRVGLVWAGGPHLRSAKLQAVDRRRSITLAHLAPLAGIEGVSFVSLQKGKAAGQPRPDGLVLHDWTAELDDFADTAALVEALDLVISVDTAVAHLAGALGKPVWLLNRSDTCWRWLLDREDSPWYPALRQFRQSQPGRWDDVIERLAASLADLAAAHIAAAH